MFSVQRVALHTTGKLLRTLILFFSQPLSIQNNGYEMQENHHQNFFLPLTMMDMAPSTFNNSKQLKHILNKQAQEGNSRVPLEMTKKMFKNLKKC